MKIFLCIWLFKNYFYLYAYECSACLYICVACVHRVHQGRKKASDNMGLNLELLENHSVWILLTAETSSSLIEKSI